MAIALDSITRAAAGVAPEADEAARALRAVARDGASLAPIFEGNRDNVDSLGEAVDRLRRRDLSPSIFEKFFDGISVSGRQAEQTVKAIDEGLATLVRSGNAEEALDSLESQAELAGLTGEQYAFFRSQLTEFDGALAEHGVNLREGASATDELGGAQETLGGAIDPATGAVVDQVEALEGLVDELTNAAAQVLGLRDAQRDWESALDDARDAIEENGQTLDRTTEAGRANEAALDSIAETAWRVIDSMRENGASQTEIQAKMRESREAFISTAEAMGLSREAAEALADSLRLVPAEVSTTVTTPGLDSSFAKVKAYVEYVERNRQLSITTNVRAVTVNGVSTTARALDRANGSVDYYASGGMESHVAQIAPAGAWRVWAEPETGGEAYIPLSPAKRARSEAILSTVAAEFGGTYVRMGDGGMLGAFGGSGQTFHIGNVWYPQADTLTDSAPEVARRSVHMSGAGRAGRG